MQSDWGETYAPVGKLTSVRYLASLAAGLGLSIDHMEAVTAFLNPEVDNPDLYRAIPEGWDSSSGGNDGTGDRNSGGNDSTGGRSSSEFSAGSIVRLRKALYGLKQAPRLWYKAIDEFLRSLEFVQSHADRNVYIHGKANTRMLLLLYVDDISLAYPRTEAAAVAAAAI